MNETEHIWRATLDDGTTIRQRDSEGNTHSYESLPFDRIRLFEIVYLATDEVALRVLVNEGERLVWRRRVEMKNGDLNEVCHIIAKKSTDNQWHVIGWFQRGGNVEFSPGFLPTSKWFHPPTLKEFEE